MAGFIFKVYTEVEINLQRGYVTKILFNFNTAVLAKWHLNAKWQLNKN